MSDATTIKLLEQYEQMAPAPGFFTQYFRTPQSNFHSSEEVEIDIVRADEDVAIHVQMGSKTYTMNKATNKKFVPPRYSNEMPISAQELIARMPGEHNFADTDFQAKLVKKVMQKMVPLQELIYRGIELQAAQVHQTGVISSKDETGTVVFSLDYGMRSSHKITAGTSWATATGDQMLANLEAAADVIRKDHKVQPDQVIMGISAFNKFIRNSTIQGLFDNRRIDMGALSRFIPQRSGANYRGTIEIGNTKLDVLTYDGRYKDPQTGTITDYLAPGNVILKDSAARMDLTFGAVPRLVPPEARVARYLPAQFRTANAQVYPYVYVSPNGADMFIELAARPLCIPTAIDSYACVTTGL